MDRAHVQARNPESARQLEMLPALLMANMRDLLQATSVSLGALHLDSPESLSTFTLTFDDV